MEQNPILINNNVLDHISHFFKTIKQEIWKIQLQTFKCHEQLKMVQMDMLKPTITSNIPDNKLQEGMPLRFEKFSWVAMFIIEIFWKREEKMFPLILIDFPLLKPSISFLR